jgi:hypothetical protein
MSDKPFYHLICLIVFHLVLTGCSENKGTEQTEVNSKTATEQKVGAIKDYDRKPIDMARGAKELGDERTKAVAEAARGQ